MKPNGIVLALVVCAALAIAAVLATGRAGRRSAGDSPSNAAPGQQRAFTVHGRIVSLDVDSGIVKIAHEAIEKYMPAMTMPFMVRDSNSLRNLKPGDDVTFVLTVTERDSWISGLSKTGPAQPLAAAETQPGNADHLRSGQKVPDFDFVDQAGKTRSFSDFAGKYAVLTFIYTRCPLPNFCPLLSNKFAELQKRLAREFPGEFQLISVTIDPKYDTPAVLKGYGAAHNADLATWTFATGTFEQISRIAKLFGLTFSEKNPGLIDHDMRTALIAPDGRVIHIWKSNFWTPYEIRNRIEEHQTQQASIR